VRDFPGDLRRRLLAGARAAIPPRLARHYRERPAFRRRVHRFLRWSWVPLLAGSLLFADNGVASIVLRAIRIRLLERQVAALERRNDRLRDEIDRREKDPAAIEELARERYGMAYPGEKVYRIIDVTPAEGRRLERERRRLEREAAELEAATSRPESPDARSAAR
jgi:cell division protein FtsB